MKKKSPYSEEVSPGKCSADYTVGQVSGSLFQKSDATAGPLFTLFTAAAPAESVIFQPACKVVKKSVDRKDIPKDSPKVKDKSCMKKKPKDKCAADQTVEKWEQGLQEADEEEQGQEQSLKKVWNIDEDRDASYWVMKRQKLRTNKEEEAFKCKRTVFVGNLPISVSKKTLRSIFRDSGLIESIRFRSLVREDPSMSRKLATIKRQVHPKKQSINAYVVFKEEGGATKAQKKNGLEIEKDFHIRVDRVAGNSSHDHRRSIFVGNLPFDITEVAFRKHFEEIGAVEAVRLVRDQNSGMGKGFGYVLFERADSVQLALELNGSKLAERAIRVMRSVKKEKNKKQLDNKRTLKRTGKSPMTGPIKGPKKDLRKSSSLETTPGGFSSQKQFAGKRQSTKGPCSFKGEMVDPSKRMKNKGMKRKKKSN